MVIFLGLAMISQYFGLLRDLFVVGCNGAAFTASAQVFARVKAECGRASHRSGLTPAILFFREIFSAVRLAGVFDNDESELLSHLKDGIHVRGLPIEMNRDHRSDGFAQRTVDIAARASVECALGLHILAQKRRIQRIGPGIHIHEIRKRSGLRNCLGRGNECVRNRENNVSRLNTRASKSKTQGISTAADAHAMFGVAKLGEFTLKSLDGGAPNECSGSDGCRKSSNELILEFDMRCNEIDKGNRAIHGHSWALAFDGTGRKIFAGLPATMTFGGTSRVTTLPAPTIEFSPTITLERTVAPEPMDAPRLMTVASTFQSLSVCSSPSGVVERGYESLIKVTPWPMKTLSSMATPSQTNVWLETLQRRPTVAFFWISTKAPIFVSSPISHPYKLMNLESRTPFPNFTSGAIEQNSFTGVRALLSA